MMIKRQCRDDEKNIQYRVAEGYREMGDLA